MSQDEVTKLFRYMSEHFDNVNKQFADQRLLIDKLDSAVDQIIKHKRFDL